MRLVIGSLLAASSALWLLGKPWSAQGAQAKPSPKATYLFSLDNTAVNESSGVAASRRSNGIYWTHNDSGGEAAIFAFDGAGKDLGKFVLRGIRARDWEDMASSTLDGVAYLYIGDIGDNLKNQRSLSIHRFPEPKVTDSNVITEIETYTVTFPDGPHNCEALMVAPNGDIFLVTKDDFGDSKVFKLARPKGSGDYKLSKIADLKVTGGNVYSHRITGGDISRDGKRVVLRTYFSLLLYESKETASFASVAPVSLPVPLERQGEAVCFDEANDRLITTTEGAPCRVSAVSLP